MSTSGNFRRFPCPGVQRLSERQKECCAPCNSGDTAADDIDRAERDFENIFFPFSRTYKSKNFECKPVPRRFNPADRGSGRVLQRVGRGGKGGKCQPKCKLDGNPNNNTINQFEAGELCFERTFETKFTPEYLTRTKVCRDQNVRGTPFAKQGTGSASVNQRRRRCNRNTASDFCIGDWNFENQVRLTKKCRN